jgi:hypothetical protein
LEVSLPQGEEAIRVQIAYRILPEPGTGEVPLSALTMEPTRLLGLRASLGGEEADVPGREGIPLRLGQTRDHFHEGSVRLPEITGPEGARLSLHVGYTVEGAWTKSGTATIPLIVPRWIPADPTPETFLARIDVPEGLTIVESFPTSVLKRPPPGKGGVYEIGLQGVPAMLVLRVVPGAGSFLTLERTLDLLVVLILLGMGALGVRYLRGKER